MALAPSFCGCLCQTLEKQAAPAAVGGSLWLGG